MFQRIFAFIGNMISSLFPSNSGKDKRDEVFEVIVRQALAGAPWRELCSGPMQEQNISHEEIEEEVRERQKALNSQ